MVSEQLGHVVADTSRGRHSGPRPLFPEGMVTAFRGKTDDYIVETYSSNGNKAGFAEIPEYSDLVDTVTALYLAVYPDRDREISIERARRSLSHPRTILELVIHQNDPVGFGIFPRLHIDLPGGLRERVIYSTRAFKKEHEGEGLGTHVLSEAIRLHQEEVRKGHQFIHYGALMTQNPLSVLTLGKIPSVERIFPFRELYIPNSGAQHIMLGVHNVVMLNSQKINTITGMSEGELREIGMNETYRPDSTHQDALDIHRKMVIELGMNREAGDVVYVVFTLKRPNGIAQMSLDQAA